MDVEPTPKSVPISLNIYLLIS